MTIYKLQSELVLLTTNLNVNVCDCNVDRALNDYKKFPRLDDHVYKKIYRCGNQYTCTAEEIHFFLSLIWVEHCVLVHTCCFMGQCEKEYDFFFVSVNSLIWIFNFVTVGFRYRFWLSVGWPIQCLSLLSVYVCALMIRRQQSLCCCRKDFEVKSNDRSIVSISLYRWMVGLFLVVESSRMPTVSSGH